MDKPPFSSDAYPSGSVRLLLTTERVTPPTRAILDQRQQLFSQAATYLPPFFSSEEFALFTDICARLMPPFTPLAPRWLASEVDAWLVKGEGNGWRYDALPTDGDAYRAGLDGLASAGFASFTSDKQNAVLASLRDGSIEGKTWHTLPPARFFEEMLAELSEIYFSHPLVSEKIGYTGMADAKGWKHFGL